MGSGEGGGLNKIMYGSVGGCGGGNFAEPNSNNKEVREEMGWSILTSYSHNKGTTHVDFEFPLKERRKNRLNTL